MADRYWVNGTGTWSSSSTANWSTTSGGASGASVPTASDNVFFNSNSNVGTGSFTVTISSTVNCLSLTVTTLDGVMTLAGTGLSLNINGSLTLVSANLLITYTRPVRFRATTTGHTIFTAGKTFNTMNFEGVGGGWTLLDALTLTSTTTACISLTNGTLNTNSQTVTLATGGFTTSGANTKVLQLGNSTIINAGSWQNNSTAGLTISAGTSTIIMTGNGSLGLFRGGGLTYSNLEFYPPTTTETRNLQGANTFGLLRIYAGTSTGVYPIAIDSDQVVANFQTFNVSGNPTERTRIVSNTRGTIRSINVSVSTNLNYTDFGDINAAGNFFAGTSLGDLGNNVNITFPAAKTVYWNLGGSQNWTSTGWAITPGGAPNLNNFPLAQDTAVFDNSGAAGTVTLPSSRFAVGTLTTAARTNAVTLSSGNLDLTGDFSLGSGVTSVTEPFLYFVGYNNTQNIYSNGFTHGTRFLCEKTGASGNLGLQDAFSNNVWAFALLSGVFQTNNFNFTVGSFISNSTTSARTLSLGSSTVTVTAGGFAINTTGATISSNTAQIYMNAVGNKTFSSLTSYVFYNIIQNGLGELTLTNVTGNNISTALLTTTIRFGGTNTFNSINLDGAPSFLNILRSETNNNRNGIITTSSPTNINTLNYVNVQDLQFNTPASTNLITWYATNSTNSGNNLGILFSDTSKKVIYILSGATITLPNDWNPNNNKIYLIGGGGGGAQGFYNGSSIASGGGGGGGGFSLVQNFSAAPGTTISYSVGSGGGSNQFGVATTWNGGVFQASGGTPGNVAGVGGTGGFGSTFNGGNGGSGLGFYTPSAAVGGGGGGGAGGPLGVGANGGSGSVGSPFGPGGGAGGGGGGNGGGSNGQPGTAAGLGSGGAGGNNFNGVGGGAASSTTTNAGTLGGGSSGYVQTLYIATTSSTGVDILNSLGSSGGGGSGPLTGQNAGFFGGGGGGGGGQQFSASVGGSGGQGVIILEYTPNTDFLMFMSAR